MKKISGHFKLEVYNYCVKKLEERIFNFSQAMKNAQEASNSEDKSSAGDKYETARAMGQMDRDMNARQLAEAQTELATLLKVNIEIKSDKILSGQIIETNQGIYFIAAGIGQVEIKSGKNFDCSQIIVLSQKSPLALEMMGKKKGEEFIFNQKRFQIINVA